MIDDYCGEHILLKESVSKGIEVVTVFNEKEALIELELSEFDLITIDINLLTDNGYEVAGNLSKYDTDILLNSTGINHHYPVHMSETIETISKEELANYINKKASKYGLPNI